jgi:hypothetical protein
LQRLETLKQDLNEAEERSRAITGRHSQGTARDVAVERGIARATPNAQAE